MTLADILVAVAAIGALAVSIITLIMQRRDKRIKLGVAISNGLIGYSNGKTSEWMLFPEVSNPNDKPIHIRSFTVILPDKKTMIFPYLKGEKQIPFTLEPLEAVKFFIPFDEMREKLKLEGYRNKVKIRACFTDGIGNSETSKPWIVKLND